MLQWSATTLPDTGNEPVSKVSQFARRKQRNLDAPWKFRYQTTKEGADMHQHGRRRRLDLHNSNIDYTVALAGQCGFTHLDTGRVCHLLHRHPGPCELHRPALADPPRTRT